MSLIWHKKCLLCGKPFDTRIRNQVYCSRVCSGKAHQGVNLGKRPRKPPEMVKIRLQKQLPVFPEFQLTPGVVYPAEKYQSCHDGRETYIVTLDADHRTLVRQEECEEVLSDEQ